MIEEPRTLPRGGLADAITLKVVAGRGLRRIARSALLTTAVNAAFGCWLGASSPACAGCDEIDPVPLLPENQACASWLLDGESIGAYSLAELMVIVDGGAFLYERHGFVAAGFQNYRGPGSIAATLALFNQGSADSALALYLDPASGSGEPIPTWAGSGEARLLTSFGVVVLEFREACFFGRVTVLASDDPALIGVRCLAEEAAARIFDAVPIRPVSWGRVKAEAAGPGAFPSVLRR